MIQFSEDIPLKLQKSETSRTKVINTGSTVDYITKTTVVKKLICMDISEPCFNTSLISLFEA